jgi:UDP-N-acetylglucosamine 1-carboxyvinyltransferase
VGSFIGLAAMTRSDITIKNAGLQHLGVIPERFQQLGIQMNFTGDDIHIPSQELYEIQKYMDGGILTIYDHPWPGFTPDLLSIVLVTAIQAKGSVLIHQKMFESRLFFVDKLIDMGAQVILCDPHRAVVVGLEREQQLRGITMSSPDIRAGVALLIAALSAEGKSVIQNIEQIDRGYQNIDARLQALGADIKRIS